MVKILKTQSLWTLTRWIIIAHLVLQTVLFLWAMNGVSSGFGFLGSLSQTGLACIALSTLWFKRNSTTSSLGPSGFAFRTGVLWCLATIVLLFNHAGYAIRYGDIAFITSQVTGTVFAVLVLGIIGTHMNQVLRFPLGQALSPAILVGGSFMSELGAALLWPSAPMWFFALLSLSEATSAIIAIWMLGKLEAKK